RRRHADLETFRRLASRRAGLHSCDNARPQVTRIGLRHPSPPKGESMRKDLLIPSPMGIPPIQISREPLELHLLLRLLTAAFVVVSGRSALCPFSVSKRTCTLVCDRARGCGMRRSEASAVGS